MAPPLALLDITLVINTRYFSYSGVLCTLLTVPATKAAQPKANATQSSNDFQSRRRAIRTSVGVGAGEVGNASAAGQLNTNFRGAPGDRAGRLV